MATHEDQDVRSIVTGGCLCGAVRYEATVAPSGTHYCHCRMCQKNFGSAMGSYTSFPRDSFRFVKGEPKRYRSSKFAQRGFCALCGSPLTFEYLPRPEKIGITIGSLDHPEALQPEAHWGIESALPWLHIADDLPRQRTDEDPDFISLSETENQG